MSTTLPLSMRLAEIRRLALLAGGGGVLLSLLLSLIGHRIWSGSDLMHGYLVAYLYWVGIALGCISLTCLHNLVGGGWGMAIRRPLEAGAMTILPLALLFLPILIGAGALYPWVHPDAALAAEIAHKRSYMSVGGFALRALLYFLLWGGLAYLLNRFSAAQDHTEDPAPTQRMMEISGPGLAIMFLSSSFAAIDWAMSLEPRWYSTIYGAMLIVGWGLTTFALMIVAAGLLSEHEPEVAATVDAERLNDLGNLMMAFVMLWAYMSFSQLLIIWMGNLHEEIPWYLKRSGGGWWTVSLLLILFHFFAPFLVLIFKETKRRVPTLMAIAGVVAVMHLVNMAWLVLPSAIPDPLHPYFTWGSAFVALIATVGIGGICLASFLWFLEQKDLIPRRLPGLGLVIEPAGGH